MKHRQKIKVIVVVAIAITVVFGVLLIAYCIYNRKNFKGTFFDPLWEKYHGKLVMWKNYVCFLRKSNKSLVQDCVWLSRFKKNTRKFGIPKNFFSILKIGKLKFFLC